MNTLASFALLPLAILIFGACSSPAPLKPPLQEALECEIQKFPCTWKEVSPILVERSLNLSKEAGAKLKAGATINQIAAYLKTQETLAELQYDEHLLRFRLPGGRGVWVGKLESVSFVADTPAPANTLAMAKPPSPSVSLTPQGVVRSNTEAKRALVLAPVFFENAFAFADAPKVANILQNTRGYAGNVHYLANTTAQSQVVTIDDYTGFDNYDLVYITTHGGQICNDQTGKSIPCRGFLAAEPFDGSALDLLSRNYKGVELFQFESGAQLVVEADFFRSQYPAGLSNKLIYIDACYSASMAPALRKPGNTFLGWSDVVYTSTTHATSTKFFTDLASGHTTEQVYQEMGSKFWHDSRTGAILDIGSAKLRTRELLTLSDAITGHTLSEGATMEVSGEPEDGQPDILLMVLKVDGVHTVDMNGEKSSDADRFVVHIEVSGQSYINRPLKEIGTYVDASSWEGHAVFNLGYDVKNGQTLNIKAWVELPEGGTSSLSASPVISQVINKPPKPAIWQGISSQKFSYAGGPGSKAIITVTAKTEFELHGSATGPLIRYTLARGSLTASIKGNDSGGCDYTAVPATINLPADSADYLEFNLSTGEVQGKGSTVGPNLEVLISCPGQAPLLKTVSLNSLWLNIPTSAHQKVFSSGFNGSYQTDLYTYTWEFSPK